MARIDELLAEIRDPALQGRFKAAVDDLRRHQRFGLVFEEHVPETTALGGLPARVGATVQRRADADGRVLYRVAAIDAAGNASLEPVNGEGVPCSASVHDLLVVKPFGEPIYAALKPLGAVARGAPDRPFHAIVSGENFHALQLFAYLYDQQVDCIYIDPPYNTGARDWKYNNRYVDDRDAWRHSKWLSFMQKRLELARRLLKPDGVLIVTIDEHEVHHLGMLLEQLFPAALRQMVTVAINPSGATGDGFSRVDEYAFFVFLGGARPNLTFEDFFGPEDKSRAEWWESLLRRGSAWSRSARPNLCYPVLIDGKGRIAGAGEPFVGDDESARPTRQGKYELAWPVRTDGTLGIWRVGAAKLREMFPQGYAVATERDPARGTWSIRYLLDGAIERITEGTLEVKGRGPYGEAVLAEKGRGRVVPKTMWHRARHAAGATGGTNLLRALLGESGAFSYPKSVYAVRDMLDAAIGGRRDALVLDFFGGSGTTLHATCLLNARDGGRRRCVLVTNNEVSEDAAKRLHAAGVYRGDEAFEREGIFERVTRPRCEAAIRGVRRDGKSLEGDYPDGRPYAAGFEENAEFFRIEYLDPDDVDLGRCFEAILPALWLAAGGVGPRAAETPGGGLFAPEGSTFAVLMRPSGIRRLRALVAQRPEVTHAWVVTDSEEAYAEARAALPKLRTGMLYRDYLRSFRINVRPAR